jgi:hypothetical protein
MQKSRHLRHLNNVQQNQSVHFSSSASTPQDFANFSYLSAQIPHFFISNKLQTRFCQIFQTLSSKKWGYP